jgi:hypothetical protein
MTNPALGQIFAATVTASPETRTKSTVAGSVVTEVSGDAEVTAIVTRLSALTADQAPSDSQIRLFPEMVLAWPGENSPGSNRADVPSAFAAQGDADQHFAEITATAFPAAKGTCP